MPPPQGRADVLRALLQQNVKSAPGAPEPIPRPPIGGGWMAPGNQMPIADNWMGMDPSPFGPNLPAPLTPQPVEPGLRSPIANPDAPGVNPPITPDRRQLAQGGFQGRDTGQIVPQSQAATQRVFQGRDTGLADGFGNQTGAPREFQGRDTGITGRPQSGRAVNFGAQKPATQTFSAPNPTVQYPRRIR